ncbi:PTS system N-acetylglucosamine-specific IIC component [Scopulibacillus daqui]|uniref:PTS system N-acetylglucosamine-specific IIC component n=1 Tax=Scopulibacillus daqui TaxID=1469162 RepID=A0ABS2Q2L7_9BACL|nr:N-acetylglucosamine-specific PTS transporter subunit IIBC [Scopulibacillus daqui]MBM7646548.1 PTS system N-acetylglucosamine-specific IIC component [Scopulibacillus daqui]
MLGFLQKIGKSLMLPIAVLPAAAILLRLGQPDLLNIKFIMDAGQAVFTNLALIFAIGIAVGFAKDNNGAAALAGVVGYFVLTAGVHAINKDINMDVLGGIITGVVAGLLYNRFHDIKLPDWLSFFGGRRFVPIITAVTMLILALIFGSFWIYVQNAINAVGNWIIDAGSVGAAIYGLLNRLLIPLGLHHVLNSFIWFVFGDYHGVHGEINRFFAHDPNAGLLLAGFFPIFMFGLPAACFAMIAAAKPERRKEVTGFFAGIALTAFLTGVTEPIEFTFMFIAPVLYGVHALLTASSMAITYLLGIHDGFGFSAGAIDYVLNFGIAQKPLLLLLVGIVYAVIYFIVFYFLIKIMDIKTPGRDDEKEDTEGNEEALAGVNMDDKYEVMAARFLSDIGGRDNITNIDNCTTRLRLNVKDSSLADEAAIKRHGGRGVVKLNKTNLQIIVGTSVEFVADAMKRLVQSGFDPSQLETKANETENENIENTDADSETCVDMNQIASPLKGEIMPISEVPDQVFSQKMMGDGFAVNPEEGELVSPVNGTIKTLFPTKHAIGIESEDGLEILIHVGLDTVNLKGEGFDLLVQEGENITQGQKLMKFDLQGIKEKVPSVVTPIVFTNLPEGKEIKLNKTGKVNFGEKDIIDIK